MSKFLLKFKIVSHKKEGKLTQRISRCFVDNNFNLKMKQAQNKKFSAILETEKFC